MHFGDYLKLCRQTCKLTQDELVSELYTHNIEYFEHLESTTISKWEKNSPTPRMSRQISILKYFQKKMNTILPCFEHYSLLEVEEKLSLDNMQTLLGKSEKIVLNFPKFNKTIEELNIYNLRDIPFIKDKIIKLNSKLENDFNYGLSDFYTDKISEWSQTKDNIFLICSLEDSFLGYLFALRLKPKIFTKLVNLEMKESEIKQEHFASLEEMGSDYFLSFFAMNKEAAALLFIKYYAQLVINQKSIHEVGGATMLEDAKKLIEKMCLQRHKAKPITLDDGEEIMLQTYKESLANFIACESVLKLIFQYDKK